MMKHHQARAARPESENSTQFRWVSGAIEPMKMGGVREMLRARKPERLRMPCISHLLGTSLR